MQGDFKKSKQVLATSLALTMKKRHRNTWVSTLTKWVRGANYNHYTDEEAHAELIYGEVLVLFTLASFFSDMTTLTLIKGAFRLNAAYNSYK